MYVTVHQTPSLARHRPTQGVHEASVCGPTHVAVLQTRFDTTLEQQILSEKIRRLAQAISAAIDHDVTEQLTRLAEELQETGIAFEPHSRRR